MQVLLKRWVLIFVALAGVVAAGAALILSQPDSDRALAEGASPGQAEAASPEAAPSPPVDQEFVIRRVLPIAGPIKYGEWHWDEENVPDGQVIITVDLDARVISIFRGGYEIGAAAVLLGTDEKPTPLGVFPIMQKKRHHVSNIYDAPMPFMQRLTNDGVALHETKVELGYASHGCVGLPSGFAEKVFSATKVGDPVIITRGKRTGLGKSLVG